MFSLLLLLRQPSLHIVQTDFQLTVSPAQTGIALGDVSTARVLGLNKHPHALHKYVIIGPVR